MVQHLVKQFALIVLSQHGEKVTVAHVACCQTSAVRLDVLDEVLEHSLIVALRYQLQIECQRQSALTASCVGLAFGIVERTIEGVTDAIGSQIKQLGILLMP